MRLWFPPLSKGNNMEARLHSLYKTSIAPKLMQDFGFSSVKEVAFDRSGYRYHGRVRALADAAREGGLSF